MIIGKSLTAIVSGGLEPEIHVTAIAGTLLNLHLKNSSVILQSYQLGASETQHTFIVNMSNTAYIIDEATNGNSVEVLVNNVSLFNVAIQYAYITVTAKAGALLKLHLKNSSTILRSYQLGPSETTHTFIVNTNSVAYVIDDTTNGRNVEVLVSSFTQYNVTIQYAYITVTAKAGALLKLHLKNSASILQSHQLGSSETQHTFIVDVNSTAYVIDDTTNGRSAEVLVNSYSVFNVTIQYAYITVTAKAGALLKLHLKNSSTILQSYQLGSSETQHTFPVDVNSIAYVIDDATNGKSVEVLVNSSSTFSVKIDYYFYLYNLGDQCTSVTGGWEFYEWLVDQAREHEPRTVGMETINEINLSGYSKIYIEYYYYTNTSYKPADVGYLGYNPCVTGYDYDDDQYDSEAGKLTTQGSRTLVSFNIPNSALQQKKKVYFGVKGHYSGSGDTYNSIVNSDNLYVYHTTNAGFYKGTRSMYVYKIYLE